MEINVNTLLSMLLRGSLHHYLGWLDLSANKHTFRIDKHVKTIGIVVDISSPTRHESETKFH